MQVNIETPRKAWNLGMRKEVCKRGHPLSGDNLMIRKNGGRGCRQCKRDIEMDRYYGRVSSDKGRRSTWTDAKVAILVEMWPDHTASQVADKIGCDKTTVQKKSRLLGLRKSDEFYKKHSNASRFGETSKNCEEREILKVDWVFSPVHSTAMLLMLPCEGLGLEVQMSESSKESLKRFKDNEENIKADLSNGKGMTKTASKYGLCFRSLKKFLEEIGYSKEDKWDSL